MSQDQTFEGVPDLKNHGVQKELTIFGARTRYWEYGNPQGKPMVLIHGFRGDHHGLEFIAQHLQNFKVIVPDLPGFGKSEPLPRIQHSLETFASWLEEFIAALQLGQKTRLVGHSFGSIVCSYYAMCRPAMLHTLTLINPISEPALQGQQRFMSTLAEFYYAAGAALPDHAGFAVLRAPLITRISSEFMMKNHDRDLRTFINSQHDAYFSAFSSRTSLLETYQASIQHTASEYATAIRVPTLMVVAEKDDLGTLTTQQEMFEKLPCGTLEIVPDVGHLVHYETPRKAAELITRFNTAQESAQ